jgi:hypothetical protein
MTTNALQSAPRDETCRTKSRGVFTLSEPRSTSTAKLASETVGGRLWVSPAIPRTASRCQLLEVLGDHRAPAWRPTHAVVQRAQRLGQHAALLTSGAALRWRGQSALSVDTELRSCRLSLISLCEDCTSCFISSRSVLCQRARRASSARSSETCQGVQYDFCIATEVAAFGSPANQHSRLRAGSIRQAIPRHGQRTGGVSKRKGN